MTTADEWAESHPSGGWTNDAAPAVRSEWEWNAPFLRTLDPEHYADPDNHGLGIHRRWADHREKRIVDGIPTYSAHPYKLDGQALDDLHTLRKAGWRVRITGSAYNPGATVRVDITPPAYLKRGGDR